jgi:hypothetical protein
MCPALEDQVPGGVVVATGMYLPAPPGWAHSTHVLVPPTPASSAASTAVRSVARAQGHVQPPPRQDTAHHIPVV